MTISTALRRSEYACVSVSRCILVRAVRVLSAGELFICSSMSVLHCLILAFAVSRSRRARLLVAAV